MGDTGYGNTNYNEALLNLAQNVRSLSSLVSQCLTQQNVEQLTAVINNQFSNINSNIEALQVAINTINSYISQIPSGNIYPLGVISTPGIYSVAASDFYIYANATAGTITVMLPPATGSGRLLVVKKIDSSANAVTVQASAGNTIDGSGSQVIVTQYASLFIQDVMPGNWFID